MKPHQRAALPVVAHGAIAVPELVNGKPLAAIVVDTSARPDIEEHVRLHIDSGPFDVKTTWADVEGEGRVCLILEFQGPTLNTAIVKFNLSGQLKAVDRILRYKFMYFTCGRPGHKVTTSYGSVPSMIVEVAGEWPLRSWNKLLQKNLFRAAREGGLSRRNARLWAENEILSWRRQDALINPGEVIA